MQFAGAYYTVMVDLTQIAFFGLRLKIAFLNEVSHIAVFCRACNTDVNHQQQSTDLLMRQKVYHRRFKTCTQQVAVVS